MMPLLLLLVAGEASAGVQLNVSPTVVAHSNDIVQITWSGVSNACVNDTISLFVQPHARQEMGFFNVTMATGWAAGHGTVSLPLVNVRADVRFAYVSHCAGQPSNELASAQVSFADVFEPTQLHLALTQRTDRMRVMFTTAVPPSAAYVPLAQVQALDANYQPTGNIYVFTGVSTVYNASDLCNAPANTTAGFINVGAIHDVLITSLSTASLYRYRVAVTNKTFSAWRPFVTPPPVGAQESVNIVMFGDMGVKTPFTHTDFWMKYGVEQQIPAPGSVALVERYVAEGVPTFLSTAAKNHFGDKGETTRLRNAARRWGTERSVHAPTVTPRLVVDIGDISYARGLGVLWEYFMQSIDNLASAAPFMVGIGNHEYDHPGQQFHPKGSDYGDDSLGECGVPYGHRFHMPSPYGNALPPAQRNLWYSFDFGPIHFTFMSSEHDFTVGSPQYSWLQLDLKNVDRSVTPWLILLSHRPFYSSCGGCWDNTLGQMLRTNIGPLARKYSVDIVFTGHVHAWERTCGIVDDIGTCAPTDEQGTVYIVAGNAGNDYQLGWDIAQFATHRVGPNWSVFRSNEFGVSELWANGTYLEMIFVSSNRAEVHDRLVLSK